MATTMPKGQNWPRVNYIHDEINVNYHFTKYMMKVKYQLSFQLICAETKILTIISLTENILFSPSLLCDTGRT